MNRHRVSDTARHEDAHTNVGSGIGHHSRCKAGPAASESNPCDHPIVADTEPIARPKKEKPRKSENLRGLFRHCWRRRRDPKSPGKPCLARLRENAPSLPIVLPIRKRTGFFTARDGPIPSFAPPKHSSNPTQQTHGSMTDIPQSVKSLTLRVASAAPLDCAVAAIIASNWLIDLPALLRATAIVA